MLLFPDDGDFSETLNLALLLLVKGYGIAH